MKALSIDMYLAGLPATLISYKVQDPSILSTIYLHPSFKSKKGIPGVAHLEDSPESIFQLSPISSISRSGGTEPRLSSLTKMLSTMIGGLGDLLRAVVRSSCARV